MNVYGFRKFDQSDYDAFAGVESDNPMIGEFSELIIIVDGTRVAVYHEDSMELVGLFENEHIHKKVETAL